jgi:putative phosphoesterase
MTTRIGLISDLHATAAPVREALAIFRKNKVGEILCSGDLAGYGEELKETIELLARHDCKVILGNHDAWFLDSPDGQKKTPASEFLGQLPLVREFVIEGKRIYMVHGSPEQPLTGGIRLLDEHGDILPDLMARWRKELEGFAYDILIVGNTHQVFAERLGTPLVINPGSTKFNHTCAILTLPDLAFKVWPLSNKTPLKSWHWGMVRRDG